LAPPGAITRAGETAVVAQVDKSSETYQAGQSAGKIVGFAIVAVVVIALIKKLLGK
jgi:hypothetical protein